jgi:hypothetical protein
MTSTEIQTEIEKAESTVLETRARLKALRKLYTKAVRYEKAVQLALPTKEAD